MSLFSLIRYKKAIDKAIYKTIYQKKISKKNVNTVLFTASFIYRAAVCLLFLFCLQACKQKIPPKQFNTYLVKREFVGKQLFFNGNIQPLRQTAITSPFNGIVETMYCHYGQFVKKNEVVMVLSSDELQKQYNNTLTDYLKSKDNYLIAKAKFSGTQSLWQEGLIPKNNYLSEKSNLATARMTLIQEKYKLSEIIEKLDPEGNDKQRLMSLNIAEFDKVRQALSVHHHLISLKAPAAGMLLYPPKSGEDKLNKLAVGSAIKANQVIALVGDLNGISIEIDIPEVEIMQIYPGMRSHVTGIALGQQVLFGEVVAVNSQANNQAAMGLPSFNAIIEVNHLTPKQRQLIKVGMSASIAIPIEKKAQLLIPIAAIAQEKGESIVRLRLPKGMVKKQVVTTGAAQADRVAILSGLREGDEVIVYINRDKSDKKA